MKIEFHERVKLRDIELSISVNYAKSFDVNEPIIFDFQLVGSCDLMPLSHLILWIAQLRKVGKNVTFCLPRDTLTENEIEHVFKEIREKSLLKRIKTRSMLQRTNICKYFQEIEVKLINLESEKGKSPSIDPYLKSSLITPLTFFPETGTIDSFLDSLHIQYQLLLGSIHNAPSFTPNQIRDIVIRELGENIFDHAHEKFGHILMATYPAIKSKPKGDDDSVTRVKNVPAFSNSFFNILDGAGFTVIQVSDKGIGIPKQIKDAYRKDSIPKDKKSSPTDADLVDYSLLYYSTSKTVEQRLGKLSSSVENIKIAQSIPATGLFWVKEFVKQYHGLLVIRTAKTLICYDFLSFPENGHPENELITNLGEPDKLLRELSYFEGTIIQICLPNIDLRKKEEILKLNSSKAKEVRKALYSAVNLPPIDIEDANESFKVAKWLDQCFSIINIESFSIKTRKVIVVDFSCIMVVEGKILKAMYMLFYRLMQLQSKDCVFVLNGLSPVLLGVISSLQNIPYDNQPLIKNKALLILNGSEIDVLGLPAIECEILRNALATNSPENAPVSIPIDLIPKIDHIINFDDAENIHVDIDISELKVQLATILCRKVNAFIFKPDSTVYFARGCYLLPSHAYSEGFFNISALLESPACQRDILQWAILEGEHCCASHVITLGKLLDDLGEQWALNSKGKIQHLNLANPRNVAQQLSLGVLPKAASIIILTNVIGTSKTIGEILSHLSGKKVCLIMAIVDAQRTEDKSQEHQIYSGGKSYSVVSIVYKPIRYWLEDKPTQYSYEEIIRIDPVSNVPIRDKFSASKPIWKEINESSGQNDFISNVMQPSTAFCYDHFENAGRHLLYFVKTPNIVSSFGQEIAECINSDIVNFQTRHQTEHIDGISHIFYPIHTPSADRLALHISAKIGNPKIVGLLLQSLNYPLSFPLQEKNMTNVIFIDDASSSGQNAFNMIEMGENAGVSTIFIYIIFNRADRSSSNRLRKVGLYGKTHVHVRYLAELPIPTYSAQNCPLCQRIYQLSSFGEYAEKDSYIKDAINRRIFSLKNHPLDVASAVKLMENTRSATTLDLSLRFDVRQKLELSRYYVSIRRGLSEAVKNYKTELSLVRTLFSIIKDEESYFKSASYPFTEVFYNNFKENIVYASKDLLNKALNTSELHFALSAIAMLRIFCPQEIHRVIPTLNISMLTEEEKADIIIEAYLEQMIQGQPIPLATSTKIVDKNEISATIIKPKSKKSLAPNDVLILYRDLGKKLSDSESLANNFAGLDIERMTSAKSYTVLHSISTFWPSISKQCREDIFPQFDNLIGSNFSKMFCGNVREILLLTNSLLQRCDDLYHEIVSQQTVGQFNDTILSEFKTTCHQLNVLLVTDDSIPFSLSSKPELRESLPRLFPKVRSSLKLLVPRLYDNRASAFKMEGIIIKLDIPDDNLFVFGAEAEVFAILNSFLDNVLKRAFSKEVLHTSKTCLIRCEKDISESLTTVHVFDDGCGFKTGTQYGTGLTYVEKLANQFCHHWTIKKSEFDGYTTQASITFLALNEREEPC